MTVVRSGAASDMFLALHGFMSQKFSKQAKAGPELEEEG